MQAVVLAAGMGKRLRYATRDRPKCMVEVNGVSLIERALSILSRRGLTRFVVVIGFRGEMIRAALGERFNGVPVTYVENASYADTNNIYSLYLARHLLAEEDAILLESDVIFEETVMDRFFKSDKPNLVVVDHYRPYMDGTTVQISENDEITAIVPKSGLDHRKSGSYYKTVNIYRFSREFSQKTYIPFLDAYCSVMGMNRFYEQVLRVILPLEQKNIHALVLNGEKWMEIDTLPDLESARALFADSPGKKLALYEKRFGGFWSLGNVYDFCYLSNPFFPPRQLLESYKAAAGELLANYPSGQEIQCGLAGELLLCRENLLTVGNGASELIPGLRDVLGGRVGLMFPAFMEYPSRLGKEKVVPLHPKNSDLQYDADDLIAAEPLLDALLLVNPDNPSGNFISREETLRVVKHYGERNKTVVVDESFVDFAGVPGPRTLIGDHTLNRHPNLVVIRSLSKTFGIPGLRLGVAASGDASVVSRLRRETAIWNINSFAEHFLQTASKCLGQYRTSCREMAEARERFFHELARIDEVRPLPSAGNFILCELPADMNAEKVAAYLLFENNILVKRFPPDRDGLSGRNWLRVAVRRPDDNAYFVECLSLCLRRFAREWTESM